jgi:hypothetical protein
LSGKRFHAVKKGALTSRWSPLPSLLDSTFYHLL